MSMETILCKSWAGAVLCILSKKELCEKFRSVFREKNPFCHIKDHQHRNQHLTDGNKLKTTGLESGAVTVDHTSAFSSV